MEKGRISNGDSRNQNFIEERDDFVQMFDKLCHLEDDDESKIVSVKPIEIQLKLQNHSLNFEVSEEVYEQNKNEFPALMSTTRSLKTYAGDIIKPLVVVKNRM